MAADANSLQGSLFGDAIAIPSAETRNERLTEPSSQELSNAQLVEDAKNRPRQRQVTEPEEKSELVIPVPDSE